MNINTKEYWDARFGSGDWEKKGGRSQTRDFALSQVSKFKMKDDFRGTIVDFGCGLGDSMPVYRKCYPHAKLVGIDISESGIEICKQKYADIADFISGDHNTPFFGDVIISSNVFEHLSNDMEVAKELMKKCREIYITVPYKEILAHQPEHVNSYDEFYFDEIGACKWSIFSSKGWSEYGKELYYDIYLKNIFRFLLGKRMRIRNKQIMFYANNLE